MTLAIAAGGIGVPDWPPPFRYAHPRYVEHIRDALPAIELGLGDRVAWELLCGDVTRVELDDRGREVVHLPPNLGAYRVVYGNRPRRRRRRG